MFNQTGVVAELLHQMITGDHPLDLPLVRLCADKLEADRSHGAEAGHHGRLLEKLEVIDTAQQFNAPPRLLDSLRVEALKTLGQITRGFSPSRSAR